MLTKDPREQTLKRNALLGLWFWRSQFKMASGVSERRGWWEDRARANAITLGSKGHAGRG